MSAAASEQWRGKAAENWAAQFESAKEARDRLAKLAGESASRELTEDELVERADSLRALGEMPAALDAYVHALSRFPDNARANYAIAHHRLTNRDASGMEFLERAMSAAQVFVFPGCQLAPIFSGVG
jgi:tetratricopeptide (TPR) repeat protein